ncbi:hypothetical protein Aph01nite_50480 [Acrocarpospora phusangensis]|uniref:DUF4386 domain-containing protein n=1 Tax=Acrocarpospora phusangensis TaxID=1070424 RepID=A0A919QDI8_9ACTN|nr:hypothetical protein [Acrocarpospora phusangensis]GIH26738.1 hypothetical protein Aph01nite_50480 [Acrocarpospora phusangensis]
MRIARFATVAAPLCVVAYGLIRLVGRLDGQYGPGLDWQASHVANLIGLLLLVFVILSMRRLLSPGWGREAAVAVTLVGLVAAVVQFTADIVQGLLAADRPEMREMSREFRAIPGADLAFYQVGPQLLYVGLLVLFAMLAYAREVPWWSVGVIVASSLLPVVSLDLLPVSGIGYLVAFVQLRPLLEERQALSPVA